MAGPAKFQKHGSVCYNLSAEAEFLSAGHSNMKRQVITKKIPCQTGKSITLHWREITKGAGYVSRALYFHIRCPIRSIRKIG
jgi:hypothetical protein